MLACSVSLSFSKCLLIKLFCRYIYIMREKSYILNLLFSPSMSCSSCNFSVHDSNIFLLLLVVSHCLCRNSAVE